MRVLVSKESRRNGSFQYRAMLVGTAEGTSPDRCELARLERQGNWLVTLSTRSGVSGEIQFQGAEES